MTWHQFVHYAGPALMIAVGVIAGGMMLILALAPGL